MRVYVASSFRNERQPAVVEALRSAGHEVYDFHHPEVEGPGAPVNAGHGWEQALPCGQTWTADQYLAMLRQPLAVEGFTADWEAMVWADAFVLVLSCGRNAHLEAGYAVGADKPLAIYLDPANVEPELMHKLAGLITDDPKEILTWLGDVPRRKRTFAESDRVIAVWDNGGVWVGLTYDEYQRARSVIDSSSQPKVCPKCDRLVASAHLDGCPT